MHRLNIDNESLEYIEGDPVAAPGMITVLSEKHNILTISQEAVPEPQQGRTLIVYLQKRDCIVLAGWGQNTARIAEVITEYLELASPQHERALKVPHCIDLNEKVSQIWQTLEAIYQIRTREN